MKGSTTAQPTAPAGKGPTDRASMPPTGRPRAWSLAGHLGNRPTQVQAGFQGRGQSLGPFGVTTASSRPEPGEGLSGFTSWKVFLTLTFNASTIHSVLDAEDPEPWKRLLCYLRLSPRHGAGSDRTDGANMCFPQIRACVHSPEPSAPLGHPG